MYPRLCSRRKVHNRDMVMDSNHRWSPTVITPTGHGEHSSSTQNRPNNWEEQGGTNVEQDIVKQGEIPHANEKLSERETKDERLIMSVHNPKVGGSNPPPQP